MEAATMSHSDQRAVRAAPEKVMVRETRREAMAVGGVMRDSQRDAVAGTSPGSAMT
jgi:hypothetical protein